jgi:hypothetical protein
LPDGAQDHVKRLYEHAEEHRIELNLYITGTDAEMAEADDGVEEGSPT